MTGTDVRDEGLQRQHLIDPELCVRCNGCAEVCTRGAVRSNGVTYAIDAALCSDCGDCIRICTTGAIDTWRWVPRTARYTVTQQLGWTELPPDALGEAPKLAPVVHTARVAAVRRLTEPASASDICQVDLDFGAQPFPVLEGQSLGILPSGVDDHGAPHRMRLYSIASARHGEGGRPNCVSLTVKRVIDTRGETPRRGVASNYLCDLAPGDPVRCIGPLGTGFLLPQDEAAPMLMICTGTGIAPMRGFIERQLALAAGTHPRRMMLYYGARTPDEMAYRDYLRHAAAAVVEVKLAFSRWPEAPKAYVQDLLLQDAAAVAGYLLGDVGHIYLCGLKTMEQGVQHAFSQICAQRGARWVERQQALLQAGRLHIETY